MLTKTLFEWNSMFADITFISHTYLNTSNLLRISMEEGIFLSSLLLITNLRPKSWSKERTLYKSLYKRTQWSSKCKVVYLIYARLMIHATLTLAYPKDYVYYIPLTCGITLLFQNFLQYSLWHMMCDHDLWQIDDIMLTPNPNSKNRK